LAQSIGNFRFCLYFSNISTRHNQCDEAKAKQNSRSFFVSRAVYKRAVLFGFISSKNMEMEAVLFWL